MSDEYTVQRFRGGFAVVYKDDTGKRHREKLDAADRVTAEAEARRRWAVGDRSSWSVARIVTAYMADREAEGIASVQRQKDAWKAMKSFWADVDPLLIDKDMAKAYAARRKVADATIRYELGMLAVALRWAVDGKKLRTAPEIWRPAPPERQERHISHEDFERFYAEVKAPHARLYVLLAIYTMARPAAILDLTWDRVNFETGMIDLNPRGRRQTAKRRPVVPMNDELLAAMRLGYEARTIDHVIERGGKPVANIKKAFQAATERSGVHATPYTMRHTGAVWAAEAGASMAELAQFMGHEDSATTERHYARFSPGYLRRVANAVQRKKVAL